MSKVKLVSRKFADVSTIHVKQSDIAKLTKMASSYSSDHDLVFAEGEEQPCPIVYEYAEGFFIYAGADQGVGPLPANRDSFEKAGMSGAFLNLLDMVAKQKMAYLNLDCDATEYDELPKFDDNDEVESQTAKAN